MLDEEQKRQAAECAAAVLLEHGISMLPADPKTILRNLGVKVLGYAEMSARLGWTPQELAANAPSDDGFTFRRNGVSGVVYNDTIRNEGRVRFTLAHELGHLVLAHPMRPVTDAPYDPDSDPYEQAADLFERNLLAPASLTVRLIAGMTDSTVRSVLGLSQAAWRVRRETLRDDLPLVSNTIAEELNERFAPWLQSRRCTVCGTLWRCRERKESCPVCGSAKIEWLRTAVAPPQPETRFRGS